MKDDKKECQEVCKLIEKHFKENDDLSYTDYCFMWDKSVKKTGYNQKI
jgi:hypothetical protein